MKIAYHHEIYGIIYTLFLVLPTTLNSFVFANHSPTEREDTKNAPRPFSANNRLVGFVIQPKANLDRYESLLLVIDEYLSMCEGGWNTTLRIFNTLNPTIENSNWNGEMRRLIRYKTFCYRTNSYLPIEYYVQEPSKDPKVSSYSCLLALVKDTIKLEIGKKIFDVYVSNTDETLVKFSHVTAYLHESRKLSHAQALHTPSETHSFSIGFQSYRRLLRVGERHEDSIDEASIIAQELIERHPDVPTFHRVMVDSLPYMVVSLGKGGRVKREGSSNESEEITHYDLWIMTKSEIERELERECLFETPPLYTGPHTHSTSKCHTQKVIPIGRFFSFLVHHFYDTGDPMFPIYASYHTASRSGSSDILASWPTVLEVQEHLLLPHNISARN